MASLLANIQYPTAKGWNVGDSGGSGNPIRNCGCHVSSKMLLCTVLWYIPFLPRTTFRNENEEHEKEICR